jgi:2-oxoglutarate dehydrogenase E2 component (dihydrolipoamide succinyltransferase)
MNMAKEEGASMAELELIPGTGAEGRVTKKDMLSFVAYKNAGGTSASVAVSAPAPVAAAAAPAEVLVKPVVETSIAKPAVSVSGGHEIIEMDRMRKMIAQRMVDSKRIAPHVTSFVEADMTKVVSWRNKVKKEFQNRENESITFTPIFIEAVVKAIKDYPMINVSVDGDKIIIKKNINIGMAVALPSGNLIVPVIKNADQYNIVGLTKKVNDLAKRARENKLTPDDLGDGTFTISNVGSFGNVMGTPIIMQPQVGILALGAIQKKVAVIETEQGDMIGIRQMMFLSHSYDHRVVDGALGGMFVRRVADYLEGFDVTRKI